MNRSPFLFFLVSKLKHVEAVIAAELVLFVISVSSSYHGYMIDPER